MNLKNIDASSKDYIVEKDGNLLYIVEPKLETKTKEHNKLLPTFSSFVQKNLPTSDIEQHSKTIDVSHLRTYTFLVANNGKNPVICQVEISPDGIKWGSFGELKQTIPSGEMQIIVPQCFLRFARITFKNQFQGFNSVVTIWFQGQD